MASHSLHRTDPAPPLAHRKDTNLQTLGATETKLLYILHWIILSANEECADSDKEQRIHHASPFYYLFSIPTVTVSAMPRRSAAAGARRVTDTLFFRPPSCSSTCSRRCAT